MKPKKNPKKDLRRLSGLFFSLGLAVVTFLVWRAIEWKNYSKEDEFSYKMDVDAGLDEDVDAIVMPNTPPPPPPPPPPAPPVEVKVVENDKEIEEQVFESTETTKEEVVAEVEDIQEEEVADVDVPFAVIEDKPMFEACKNLPKSQQYDCFKENLDKHVVKNFRYPEVAQEMGIQGRVYVNFRINKDGSVTILNTRGPDKSLEAEAKRIINKLPKLIPGKQRGRPTPVTFAYPIVFKLAN